MTQNSKVWLHGLVAVLVSSFSTAAGSFLVLPDVFNFTRHGLENMARVVIIPTAVSVFAYLQKSPVPDLQSVLGPGDKAAIQNLKIDSSGNVTGSSAVLEKASNGGEVKP